MPAALCGDGCQVQRLHARDLQPQHPLNKVHAAVDQLSDAVLNLRGRGGLRVLTTLRKCKRNRWRLLAHLQPTVRL